MRQQLVLTSLPGLPSVKEGDDLASLLGEGMERAGLRFESGDILIVAQKIVSKAEGRVVDLKTVSPSSRAEELAQETAKDPREVELILRESNEILRTRVGLIVVEHRCGYVCANAGIDRSNLGEGEDAVLLLPEDAQASAEALRDALVAHSGAEIGVLIVDSHGRAWRLGTVGMALGVAGLPALLDLRGEPDLYGRKLKITEVGLADELAGAGSILMGQADEGHPAVHARGFPYALAEGSINDLLRPVEEDLFR